MVKWIFFDVGNVILNDDPAMAVYYREIYKAITEQGNSISFDQLLKDREYSIVNNRNGKHYVTVALKHLGRKTWSKYEPNIKKLLFDNWANVSPLMPGAKEVIRELAFKYNLGIIANQPTIVDDILKDHGLLEYFKILGISQTIGLSKPDPAIFKWAFAEANAEPHETIMIGDRIDNDIAPAKSLGMKTIWFKILHKDKGFIPKTEIEKKYVASLERACVSHLAARNESETPDGIAENFPAILTEVERIAEMDADAKGSG